MEVKEIVEIVLRVWISSRGPSDWILPPHGGCRRQGWYYFQSTHFSSLFFWQYSTNALL